MKLLTLVLLLLPAIADAGLVKVVADMQVCGESMFCENQTSYGSGAVVGSFNGKSIVLTAAHIFEPNDKNGLPVRDNRGKVRRILVNGFPATLVGKWSDGGQAMDAAIVLVDNRFDIELPLGNKPEVGDPLTVYGWDYADRKNPQLWTGSGTFLKIERKSMGQVSFTSGVGVSGGPAVDRDGNLCGILCQSSGVQVNYDFRKWILSNIPGANLPPASVKKYVRNVPEPKDVPPPPKSSKSAELIAAEKETDALKAALERAKVKLAEKAATPPPKETAPPPPKEKLPPKETVVKAPKEEKTTGGKIATGVSKTLDTADSLASNPWIIAGITLLTGGAGAGGLKAFQVFSAARKLRKKLHPLPSDRPGAEVPDPDSFQGAERQLHTRDETEARELLRLRQLEGRSPLLDSFVGVAFQDFVNNDLETESLPDEQKVYIRDLWSRINQRVESAAPITTGSEHSQDWRTK
tara:strand:- start:16429 stop:17823 length:1395 start_codon:yes stop_codon:yes gene_type:complete